jgi:Fur family ferric uptake transcriptional regulator
MPVLFNCLAVDDCPAQLEMPPETEHDHLGDVDSAEVLELASEGLATLRSRRAAELGYEILSQHWVLRVRKLKKS